MKSKERKNADLVVLTEQFKNSKSAMVLSFDKLTVDKDQQFRNELREAGATYKVVKNTLARIAVKGTDFEEASEHFKGVTSVAWTSDEPVELSKVVSKYLKEDKDIFGFKTGIVDGVAVDLDKIKTIASLPSKDELIAKLLYVLNAPAQGVATVLNAVPRDLAIVVKQVSERTEDVSDKKVEEESKAEAPDEKPEEKPSEDSVDEKKEEVKAETEKSGEKADDSEKGEE